MPPRICLHQLPSYFAADTTLISRRQLSPAAFFSISSILHKSPLVKKASKGHPAAAPPRKGERRTFVPKKGPQREARTATPGDRKALRNRIILSNTNALEVPWLKDLDKENISDERIVGSVVGLPGEVVDSLRAVGAFKVGQGWGNYKRPACLIREEAWDLGKLMEGIQADGPDSRQTVRKLITGAMRSGKSVLLLQAMAMAFLRGWVVISLPDGEYLLPRGGIEAN
jgi:small subunit ribosomal protein S29